MKLQEINMRYNENLSNDFIVTLSMYEIKTLLNSTRVDDFNTSFTLKRAILDLYTIQYNTLYCQKSLGPERHTC